MKNNGLLADPFLHMKSNEATRRLETIYNHQSQSHKSQPVIKQSLNNVEEVVINIRGQRREDDEQETRQPIQHGGRNVTGKNNNSYVHKSKSKFIKTVASNMSDTSALNPIQTGSNSQNMSNQNSSGLLKGGKLIQGSLQTASYEITSNYTIYLQTFGRMGNVLFQSAALYMIAQKAKRGYKVYVHPDYQLLFPDFQFNVVPWERYKYFLDTKRELGYSKYDQTFFDPLPEKEMIVCYFFQSYKYFTGYEEEIRRLFRMNSTINQKATRYVANIRRNMYVNLTAQRIVHGIENRHAANNSNLTVGHVTNCNSTGCPVKHLDITVVGVHVRQGDLSTKHNSDLGHLMSSSTYIKKAMGYYREQYRNVHFIICSDNITWCQDNIPGDGVTFSTNNTWQVDSAILQQSDHVILTVGTFGWWSAFLGERPGKKVVYQNQPYKPGSYLDINANYGDYFPPHWIPMTDE